MRQTVLFTLALAACARLEAPPADSALTAAMGGPLYSYTTSIDGSAIEGQTLVVHVGGETIPPGAVVELYRARSAGAGMCVHGELTPTPCLEITDREQYLDTATVVEVEPGLWRATFNISLPYSAQSVMWLQGVVIHGATGEVSEPLQVDLLPGLCDPTAMPFGGGTGVEEDPYTICTPEHWLSMEGGGAFYRLASDIEGWNVDLHIDELYFANLDGDGRYVLEYHSDRALFGYVDPNSTIHNINFEEFVVEGDRNTAAVVTFLDGTLTDFSLRDSRVVGPSSRTWSPDWRDYATGGLVALSGASASITNGDINYIGYEGSPMMVSGGHRTGAVVGYSSGTLLSDLEVYADVTGEASVGGLVGLAEDTSIYDCGMSGSVYGYQCFTGGIVGRYSTKAFEGEVGVDSIYTSAQVYGQRTDVGGVVGGAIGGFWSYIIVDSVGVYSAGTRTGGAFGVLDEGEVLGVYLTDVSVYGEGRFTGGFAGVNAASWVENVEVSDSQIYGEAFAVGGVDGIHLNGGLEDVFVSDTSVYGEGAGVGGLVGFNGPLAMPARAPVGVGLPFINNFVSPDVNNAQVHASVFSERHGTGGLIGVLSLGLIEGAVVLGGSEVHGDGFDAGGLVGTMVYGEILASTSAASVSGGSGPAGGLIGSMQGGSVYQSWTNVEVESTEGAVGGFVGHMNGGSISESFAAASVGALSDVAGGFVGSIGDGAFISDCYSSSGVYALEYLCMDEGGTPAGGFVGTPLDGQLHIVNSYAVSDYIEYGEGSDGNGFIGGIRCGDFGNADATVENSYHRDDDEDPWNGTEAIGWNVYHLTSYPALSDVVWSEAIDNPFAASSYQFGFGSTPALAWQCGFNGVVCGHPSIP